MFWERFELLCESKNMKPSPVAAKMGIKSATLTKWKNGTMPNGEMLVKVANYFDVSIDYLLGRSSLPFILHTNSEKNCFSHIGNPTIVSTPHVIAYIDMLGSSLKLKENLRNEQECIKSTIAIHNAAVNEAYRINQNNMLELDPSKLTCHVFSDNIVFAIDCPNISQRAEFAVKLSALVSMFQKSIFLQQNILLRGSICYGNLYVDHSTIIGSGLVDAYNLEHDYAYFPRVIIDPSLIDEINKLKEEMFFPPSLLVSYQDDYTFVNPVEFINNADEIKKGLDILNQPINDKESNIPSVVRKKIWFKNFWREMSLHKIQVALNLYGHAYEDIKIDEFFKYRDKYKAVYIDLNGTNACTAPDNTRIPVAARGGGVTYTEIAHEDYKKALEEHPELSALQENIIPLDE